MDSLELELLPAIRGSVRCDSQFPASGQSRSDLTLLARSFVTLGLVLLTSSAVRLGAALLALDSSHFGSSALTQNMGRLGLLPLVFDFLFTEPSTLTRGSNRLGSSAFLSGIARTALPAPTLDHVHMGSALPTRSLVCLGLVMPVPDSLHPDFPLPPHGHSRHGPIVFLWGLSRLGFVFSLPVISSTNSGSAPPLRSLLRHGPAALTLDLLHLDPFLLSHSSGKPEAAASMFGISRCGPLVLALDSGLPDFLPPPQSYARLELLLPVPDLLHMGFGLPLRSFC